MQTFGQLKATQQTQESRAKVCTFVVPLSHHPASYHYGQQTRQTPNSQRISTRAGRDRPFPPRREKPSPSPLAFSPRAYRDLIVLPAEETGELSSEHFGTGRKERLGKETHFRSKHTFVPAFIFFKCCTKIIIMKTCQFYHHAAKSPFYGAKLRGSAFK